VNGNGHVRITIDGLLIRPTLWNVGILDRTAGSASRGPTELALARRNPARVVIRT
jgi:hypothetical protein